MYTTIEPRLIALLNTDVRAVPESTVGAPSLELPPLQDPNILKASGRPLLLEPDARIRNGKPAAGSTLDSQHASVINAVDEEDELRSGADKQAGPGSAAAISTRALGTSSPQSLRKILDHSRDHERDTRTLSKKRHSADNGESEFVQLPQPPKKQRAAKQVVPPIIIGLFEPPPQAALFPPIASSSFHDSHGRNTLNTVQQSIAEPRSDPREESSEAVFKKPAPVKVSKREQKACARRKWTDEETNKLLLGVHKHGVGSWADILEDQSFDFKGRSGADLKDRFRTCCPVEFREGPSAFGSTKAPKPTSRLMAENILVDEAAENESHARGAPLVAKARKSRAHRKNVEDLAQLGIDTPFRKSLRRARRPFSEDEDREILEGYHMHGSAWSRIQRDPRFQLQSRKPTDLRDRFRNRYPQMFQAEERLKNPVSATDSILTELNGEKRTGRSSPPLRIDLSARTCNDSRDKIALAQDHSLAICTPLATSSQKTSKHTPPSVQELGFEAPKSSAESSSAIINAKDSMEFQEQSSLDGTGPYSLPFTQAFDWSNSIVVPFSTTIGEMDISRLLLDEHWEIPSSSKEKPSYTDINSILVSSVEPNGPGYYHMLEEAGELVDLQDTGF